MGIQIDLLADWERLVLLQVGQLKRAGFALPDYTAWRQSRSVGQPLTAQAPPSGEAERHLEKAYQRDLIFLLIELDLRISSTQPRAIKRVKSFSCPFEYRIGLSTIEQKIQNGESLLPHASRGILNANRTDGLLFHWGIHHFHLGTVADPTHPFLVSRTDFVLYAMMTSTMAYFLAVDRHGRWIDLDLLRLVKSNFPEVLEPFRIKAGIDFGNPLTEKDRKALRMQNVNSFLEIDGEHFIAPGGGVSLSGRSMKTTEVYIRTIGFFQSVQKAIVEHADKCRNEIERRCQCPLEEINATMNTLASDRVVVLDVAHHFECEAVLNSDRTQIVSISFAYIA